MSDSDSGMPPAGWYPDSDDPTAHRWWDGASWTDHLQAPSASAAPLTRRELRAQVGALTYGLPDEGAAVAVLEREPSPVAQVSTRELARRAAGYEAREDTEEYFGANYASEPRHQGSAQTLSGWFFAFSPLWYGGTTILVNLLLPFLDQNISPFASLLLAVLLMFGLARHDGILLKQRGYDRPPSAGWVFLPLVYFILRTVRVGRRGVPMLVVWSALQTLLVVSFVWLFSIALSLVTQLNPTEQPVEQTAPIESSEIEQGTALSEDERAYMLTPPGIEDSLRFYFAQEMEVQSIDCDPFTTTAAGSTTTCLVVGDGAGYEVILRVTPDFPDTAFVVDTITPLDPESPGSSVQA